MREESASYILPVLQVPQSKRRTEFLVFDNAKGLLETVNKNLPSVNIGYLSFPFSF